MRTNNRARNDCLSPTTWNAIQRHPLSSCDTGCCSHARVATVSPPINRQVILSRNPFLACWVKAVEHRPLSNSVWLVVAFLNSLDRMSKEDNIPSLALSDLCQEIQAAWWVGVVFVNCTNHGIVVDLTDSW